MAKRMAGAGFREEQQRDRYAPHVRAINELVDELREVDGRGSMPYVAPWHGGVEARVLSVSGDPGRADRGSGFLCTENDEQGAERQALEFEALGISPREVTLWNAYPWYRDAKGDPNGVQLGVGADVLERLIGLLPSLRVVLLQGKVAQRGWERLGERAGKLVAERGLTVVTTYGPSRQAIWHRDPAVVAERVADRDRAYREVAAIIAAVPGTAAPSASAAASPEAPAPEAPAPVAPAQEALAPEALAPEGLAPEGLAPAATPVAAPVAPVAEAPAAPVAETPTPTPVTEVVAPAPVAEVVAPAPVDEVVAPAPVAEVNAPASVAGVSAPAAEAQGEAPVAAPSAGAAPAAEETAADAAPAEARADEAASTGAPAAEADTAETPATEARAAEAGATEAPAADAAPPDAATADAAPADAVGAGRGSAWGRFKAVFSRRKG
ncbi:hypothetical protein [Cryptosporangium sp. NPDC048952]|uniref:hypothetical protein n=1 Tax=Cryptosporangium sp. NPDC048952 TaxID=3363961 RepID=UPI0037105A9C